MWYNLSCLYSKDPWLHRTLQVERGLEKISSPIFCSKHHQQLSLSRLLKTLCVWVLKTSWDSVITSLGNLFHFSTFFIVNIFFFPNIRSEPLLCHLMTIVSSLNAPTYTVCLCIFNNFLLSIRSCCEFYHIHQRLSMLNKTSFLNLFSCGICSRPWPSSWPCEGLFSRLPTSCFHLGPPGWMYSRCWLRNAEWRGISNQWIDSFILVAIFLLIQVSMLYIFLLPSCFINSNIACCPPGLLAPYQNNCSPASQCPGCTTTKGKSGEHIDFHGLTFVRNSKHR